MRLEGSVALVTGAAQGLGKAFSQALLAHGAKVFMTDVNAEQGHVTLKEFQDKYGVNNVTFMKCDVTSQAEMEETFQAAKAQFGGLDILVNNAGIGGESPRLWEKCVDINLKGVIRGSLLAMDMMRTDRGGRGGVIANIASSAAFNPNPNGPVYCATKHAVLGFTRSWAMNAELSSNKVRLVTLCPSFVDTALVSGMNPDTVLHPASARAFVQQVGLMTPETVAGGLLELLQDDDNSGAVLKMDAKRGKTYVQLDTH